MLITLNIIFFVVLGIVLFLMWRKVKIMDKNIQKDFEYVVCESSKLNLTQCSISGVIDRLKADINNLKLGAKSHEERISHTFVKIGLLANTLGYEYQPDKTTPPGYEPAKFVKKTKSGAK